MNIKTTLALLVLLIFAGIGFYAVTNRPAGPAAPAPVSPERGDRLFDDLATEAVDRLVITRGEQRVVAVRQADGWMQVEPVAFPLDEQAMQRLVGALAGLAVTERFAPGGERTPGLADVALDPPRGAVQIGEEGPTLLLGKAALGGRAYAMLAGTDEVLVVGDSVHEQVVTGSLLDLRRRTLPAPAPESVTGVTLQYDAAAIELQRIDGDWRLSDAANQRADDAAVGQLLAALGRVRAQSFAADGPASLAVYGLADPRLTLTLTTPGPDGDPQLQTLRVGGPADLEGNTLYATWTTPSLPDAVVFTVGRAQVEPLMLGGDDLRDPKLFDAGTSAHRVRIERPGQPTIALQRDGGQWRFADGVAEFAADAKQAGDLVRRLIDAEATAFAPAPDVEPAATISIATPARPEPEILRVYPPGDDGDTALAVPGGSEVAYIVPGEALEGLFDPLHALRERTVADLNLAAATALTLDLPDGRSYRVTRNGEQWSLEGDAGLERQTLTDLLARLDPLQATGWTDETALPDGPMIALTLDGAIPRTLRVEPDTRRATLDGVQGVFTVSEPLVSLLTAEYRERKLLPLADDLIRTVTLRSGERTLTVRRGGDGTLTAQPAIDEATAAEVINTVADLRVERYIDQPVTEQLASGPGLRVTIRAETNHTFGLVLRAPGDVLPSVATGEAGAGVAFIAPRGAMEALNAALDAAGTGADAPR